MERRAQHEIGRLARGTAATLIALLTQASVARAEEPNVRIVDPPTKQSCTLATGPLRTVVRIIDGETLKLDDGGEVRLIGALAPRAADADAAAGQWPPETAAIAFLSSLTLGARVRLAYGELRTDRYGRHLAHVFLADGGRTDWVQGAMLEAGMARAYGLPQNFDCARELDAHEREARAARRGLWSSFVYQPRKAERTGALMRVRFRYARVEGVVQSVTTTRNAVYVNFGGDWRKDFTARALKATTAAHPEFASALAELKGRRVAVRGWIERNNGPMIDLVHPSQIGPVDDDNGQRATPAAREAAPSNAEEGKPVDRNENPAQEKRPEPSAMDPGGVDL